MSQKYLIDGYNLLHALGLPPGRLGPQGLEKARGRLLALIAGALKEEAAFVTVVFDARHGRSGGRTRQNHQGLQVLFAVHYDEADDLIEEIIHDHPSPRKLTVVSDDHRLQRAAQRRRCRVMGCGEFLDLLEQAEKKPSSQQEKEPDKTGLQFEADKEHWLKEFADMQDDPDFQELFNPFPFEEEEF